MSLPKGVYCKDDCGKLKIKDSYHTRCSKQNTYHGVNKNIASSKVTDRRRRKEGMPSEASPSLGFWLYLNFTLGCLGHPRAKAPPGLGSCHSLFHSPSNPYPKLENFTTQNLTENS